MKTERDIITVLGAMKAMFNDRQNRFPYVSYQSILALEWVLDENDNGLPFERIEEYVKLKNSSRKKKGMGGSSE